jgi:hypothetical protein
MVGIRFPEGAGVFSSPPRPDRLWDPHIFLSNGCRVGGVVVFLRGLSGRSVEVATIITTILNRKYIRKFLPKWTLLYVSFNCDRRNLRAPEELHQVFLSQ